MTTRQTLAGALLLSILLMAGCDQVSSLFAKTPTAEDHVRNAITELKENQPPANVKLEIQRAIEMLPADSDATEADKLQQKLTDVQNQIIDNPEELAKRKPAILSDLESV